MSGVLWWLAQNTVSIALAVVLVGALCCFAQRRPAVQHALWLVALLKFIAPPIAVWPWSVGDVWEACNGWQADSKAEGGKREAGPKSEVGSRPATSSVESKSERVKRPSRNDVAESIDDHELGHAERGIALAADCRPNAHLAQSGDSNPPMQGGLAYSATNAMAVPTSEQADGLGGLPRAIFAVWLCGGVTVAGWQLRRICRFRRIVRRAVAAPPPLAEQVQRVAARLKVRSPRTLVAADLASPCIWPLARAVLLWPAQIAERAGLYRGVMAHELAHLKRRDHWVAWIELAAACLWWWNPLYWFVRNRLRCTSEMACDAVALGVFPRGRRRYARLLLEFSQSSTYVAAPAPVALATGSGARKTFERRLVMILNQRVSSRLSRPAWLAACLLALAMLPAWSWAQPAASSDTAPEKAVAAPASKRAAPSATTDTTAAAPDETAPSDDSSSPVEKAAQPRSTDTAPAKDDVQHKFDKAVQKVRQAELKSQREALNAQLGQLAKRVHELEAELKALRSGPSKDTKPVTAGESPAHYPPAGIDKKATTEHTDYPRRVADSKAPPTDHRDPYARSSEKSAAPELAVQAYRKALGGGAVGRAWPADDAAARPAGGQVDLVTLATAHSDAQSELDVARVRADQANTTADASIAKVQVRAAERKLKLLTAITQAEIEAAKAELESVQQAVKQGSAPKSKLVSVEARIKLLQLIAE